MTLPQLPDAIEPALDVIDAVLLAPGRDIEPRRYGQEPHPLLAATEPQRDQFELRWSVARSTAGLPVLGMCRGVQVLNVALGGTLVQDVSLLDATITRAIPGWRRWKEVERASLHERAGAASPAARDLDRGGQHPGARARHDARST